MRTLRSLVLCHWRSKPSFCELNILNMPELPEVETVVRILNAKIRGAVIRDAWLDWPKMIRDPYNPRHNFLDKRAVANFKKNIKGKKILGLRRVGKNVLFDFAGGWTMLVHQKMTGHFLVGKWAVRKKNVLAISPEQMKTDKWNGYIRAVFYLGDPPNQRSGETGGRMLAFSDLRRFGKMILGPKEVIEELPDIKALGPDALARDLTSKRFGKILRTQNRAIKTALMDPKVIAGVGNIYSDEALWRVGVHPERRANSLASWEHESLHKELRVILREAIKKRGTTVGDFRDPDGMAGDYAKSRRVYGFVGRACERCGELIERKKVNSRSAHYCPCCQKR